VRGDAVAGGSLSRRQQAVELAVFLLLILPSLVLSFAASGQQGSSFPLVAVATILSDLGLLALVLLLVARAGEPVAMVGWVRAGAGREAGLGLALSIPVLIGTQVLGAVLRAIGLSGPPSNTPALAPRNTPGEILLAIVLVIVVAISEETIFRGYLMLRFTAALRSRAWAVVLSSVVFAIGHGYEGGAAVFTVGLTGVVLAIIYLWRNSLVAPVVIHFVLDLATIVIAPLLTT
jgi:membrane protease YdiL (CAAX protease family)